MGLAGDSAGTISRMLSFEDYISATIVDSNPKATSNCLIHSAISYRLQVFVITASSPTTLVKILQEIKCSVWWNHMASFLILGWPMSTHGCGNAPEMLKAAWEMDLADVNYICSHSSKGRMIYTFNPFANQAPASSQLKKIYSWKRHKLRTVFDRKYRNEERICDDLWFDKSANLNGYQIRSCVTEREPLWHIITNRSGLDRFAGYNGIITKIIYQAINATAKLLIYEPHDSMGYLDKSGKPYGMLKDLADGYCEFGLNGRYQLSTINSGSTYPFEQSELSVNTHPRGNASQLSKIISILDATSVACLCLVLVMTLLFFKFILHQTLALSVLNLIVIICNGSLRKLPNWLVSRFYLGTLFLLVLNIQGIFQGKLASLLTHPVPLRNVNSRQDLVDFGHTIYGSEGTEAFFQDPPLGAHFVRLNGTSCRDYILPDFKAACVGDARRMSFDAKQLGLYTSRNSIVNINYVFPIRANWSLEEKINKVLATISETQLDHPAVNQLKAYLKKITKREKHFSAHEPLKLEHLSFAFGILVIGLTCATLVFLVELGVEPLRLSIGNLYQRIFIRFSSVRFCR